MAEMTILWWKNIPVQVIVKKSRREQFKYVLEERFEKAIDRCAMRRREIDTNSYLAGFAKSTPIKVEGDDLQFLAMSKGKELEAEYTNEKLEQIIKSASN